MVAFWRPDSRGQAPCQAGCQTWQCCPRGSGFGVMKDTRAEGLSSLPPWQRKAMEVRQCAAGPTLHEVSKKARDTERLLCEAVELRPGLHWRF